MRLSLIKGLVKTVRCSWCQESKQAGTTPYLPANGCGVSSTPDLVYTDEKLNTYCESCASKFASAEDPTRSVTRYYTDTYGSTGR